MAQFPLEMGRKKMTSNALAVQVDAEGKIKYDTIARQGQNKDKVQTCLSKILANLCSLPRSLIIAVGNWKSLIK